MKKLSVPNFNIFKSLAVKLFVDRRTSEAVENSIETQ